MMTNANLFKAAGALLVFVLGAACENVELPGNEAGLDNEGGTGADVNNRGDTGNPPDSTVGIDSGSGEDAGSVADVTSLLDGAQVGDGAISADAVNLDALGLNDAANVADATGLTDVRLTDALGMTDVVGLTDAVDTGTPVDAGTPIDTGTLIDAAGDTGDGANVDSSSLIDAAFASPPPVNLGTAGNYVMLSKTGIDTVPTSAITGDIGVSPAAPTYITGFDPLTADSTGLFSTSTQVNGKVFGSTYTSPTPTLLTVAIGDMQTAYTDASARAADVTELGAGNIGGMTLTRGVYKWGTGVLIPANLTLTGSATDVWIFEIAQNLTLSNATSVTLTGGGVPKNVFWQIAGFAELGTTSHIEGIVLAQTAIHMRTGASLNGRMFAQSAITIDSSTIVQPAP